MYISMIVCIIRNVCFKYSFYPFIYSAYNSMRTTTTFIFTLLTLLTVLNCFTWIYYYQNAIINKAKSHVQQAKDLYFDRSDIPALRAKANTTHVVIFERILQLADKFKQNPKVNLPPVDSKVFTSRWNEDHGNKLAVLAFYCVLRPDDDEAFDLVVTSMDRMAGHPTWYTDMLPEDEVPVSHSLTGFATAFDFLKDRLTEQQWQRYLLKIYKVTKNLYERAKYKWWGHAYIQNHVASITTSIFNGAIVLQSHHGYEVAAVWREWAFEHLKKTLMLLDVVVDGSMNEGTGYGSYTTRSLTQFVYLVKRHYNIDLTNFWFKQHYNFLLGTTLPGYHKILGIGDSSYTWFYGPESQLAFLEAFVLKNGEANWLASKIHAARREANDPGKFCTEHTEYLWYDPSFGERSPFQGERARSKLFRFSDAGVVTYGAGTESNETLLSFKSGPLHGRGVYTAMEKQLFPWLVSWNQCLNVGHEHPDQNSFVFYPRGTPVITEGLYGPKFTFLNNGLTFGPTAPFAKHFPPSEGQMGESVQWLAWYTRDIVHPFAGSSHAWAEVVTAAEDKGMVLFSGEAVGAYHSRLHLKSVYRMLILLNQDVLLVVDHLEVSSESVIKYANSYFNNIHNAFKVLQTQQSSKPGANAVLEGEDGEKHEIRWTSFPNGPNLVDAGEISQRLKQIKFRNKVNFLNLSIPLISNVTRSAYVFSGTKAQVQSVVFKNISNDGVIISVETKDENYSIALVTKYADVLARYRFLGTLGYGWVRTSKGHTHTFTQSEEQLNTRVLISPNANKVDLKLPVQSPQAEYYNWMYIVIVLGGCIITLWVMCKKNSRTTTHYNCSWPIYVYSTIICSLLLLLLGASRYNTGNEFKLSFVPLKTTKYLLPPVFVTTIGRFGSPLVAALFQNSTDFLYLSDFSPALEVPKEVDIAAKKAEGCVDDVIFPSKVIEWFFTSFWYILQPSKWEAREEVNQLKRHWLLYPNAAVVLHTEKPGWAVKLPYLQSAIGSRMPLRFIHIVVKDPRMWIAYQMSQTTEWDVRKHIKDLITIQEHSCTNTATPLPEYKELLARFQIDGDSLPLHKLLAMFWKANTAAVQRLSMQLSPLSYLRIHFEDLIENPVGTAERIYSFLGLSLPLSTEFHILQQTKSSVYSKVSSDVWKSKLTAEQSTDIEAIQNQSQ